MGAALFRKARSALRRPLAMSGSWGAGPCHESLDLVLPQFRMSHREVPGGAGGDRPHHDLCVAHLLDVVLQDLEAVAIELVVGEVQSEYPGFDLAQAGL